MSRQNDLLALLATRSAKRGTFTLASGRQSSLYIDARITTMSPDGLSLIGPLGLEAIRDAGGTCDAVGGLTLGADPIACAISYASASTAAPLRAFTVRKEPKTHGTGKLIEGAFQRRRSRRRHRGHDHDRRLGAQRHRGRASRRRHRRRRARARRSRGGRTRGARSRGHSSHRAARAAEIVPLIPMNAGERRERRLHVHASSRAYAASPRRAERTQLPQLRRRAEGRALRESAGAFLRRRTARETRPPSVA